MTVTDTPPGIDSPARLTNWLNDQLSAGPVQLTGIQLIAGGRSNLTYRLEVSGRPGPGCWCCGGRRSATCCPPPTT